MIVIECVNVEDHQRPVDVHFQIAAAPPGHGCPKASQVDAQSNARRQRD
jgi:hypothetical protein